MKDSHCNSLPNTCLTCEKKKNSLFDGLSADELSLLESHRTTVNYKKGEAIYKEGIRPLGLLCLNAGKVKLVRTTKNNTQQIMRLKRPVDFIDIRSVVSMTRYNHSAVALEESSVCFIDTQDFLRVLKGNSKLALKIIQTLTNELDEADSRFVNMTQKYMRARLAETILYIKDFFGTLIDNETINCTLTSSDLAGLSNMNIANVIRTLSSFRQENLIDVVKKRIVLLNPQAVENISSEKDIAAHTL
ncbi:MAG: Crp/Fnr family transcriptional regulator [Bacteroidia bacterium]|nr:Crp/Fnr family transcriptional regulator [Bacteroidia bacterium]